MRLMSASVPGLSPTISLPLPLPLTPPRRKNSFASPSRYWIPGIGSLPHWRKRDIENGEGKKRKKKRREEKEKQRNIHLLPPKDQALLHGRDALLLLDALLDA